MDTTKKKSKYKVFLVDADGTLLDFSEAQKIAFHNLMYDNKQPASEELYTIFSKINRELWKDMAEGKITKTELLPYRFQLFANVTGIKLNPRLANCSFLTHLSYQGIVLPGAKELLAGLSKRGKIAIATNGVEFVQKRRFALSGLMTYIDQIIVSDAVGAGKPDPLFFEAALHLTGNPDPESVLMVGDAPEADIRGASNCGLDSCLYDPMGIHITSEATYTIRNLAEILDL
ncbi:MAG TPA: noncanonical pyrimidine nucleotidase, YjjG family [Clostridiaceae bacterium]|nr:noncanonical pyrimidine nucleotidase, YjjG family [Clostridiaceae bacterium]